jgi:hypothetical protein
MPRIEHTLNLFEPSHTSTVVSTFRSTLHNYHESGTSMLRHIQTLYVCTWMKNAVPLVAHHLPHLHQLTLQLRPTDTIYELLWDRFTRLHTCTLRVVPIALSADDTHAWQPIQSIVDGLGRIRSLMELTLVLPMGDEFCDAPPEYGRSIVTTINDPAMIQLGCPPVEFAPLATLPQLQTFTFSWRAANGLASTCMREEMVQAIVAMPALRHLELFSGRCIHHPLLEAFSSKANGTLEFIEMDFDLLSDDELLRVLKTLSRIPTLVKLPSM